MATKVVWVRGVPVEMAVEDYARLVTLGWNDPAAAIVLADELAAAQAARDDGTVPVVHGIDRVTQDHLCGQVAGVGTDAREPAMEITCPLCRLAMERTR